MDTIELKQFFARTLGKIGVYLALATQGVSFLDARVRALREGEFSWGRAPSLDAAPIKACARLP